ncbi:coproporphyrinogen-III oxidase family protein [Micromonospora lutea]|uniref:Heme chaperone HemW n=1 Tax=Micromonospora lutea TaxID=419825 RepID=A0ABQ4IT36_9ACTN|nr:radical SAM protein [Micromonospora lutea]GIJ21068.1 coproporphyrinogen III oxidase [Micromonospora lutea]
MTTAGPMSPAKLLSVVADGLSGLRDQPLALYVHIPFCASKCHFCDWVADVPVQRLRTDAAGRWPYVTALCDQIRFYGPQLTGLGYRPTVMYWGGGTPTRLEPEEMRAVHEALDESFDLSGLRQWSMETTPNDLTAAKLETMLAMGVNRVSVGVQSLSAEQLRRAGRAHTHDQALAAIGTLRAGGMDNFNVDLISSFPTETDSTELAATLREILALDPPHVSVYPYRATRNTVMAMQLDRQVLQAWTASSMIASYELAMRMLTEAGYGEYCHGYWVRRPEDEDFDGNFKYDLAGDKIGFGSGTESILGHHRLLSSGDGYAGYLRDPRVFPMVERFSLERPEAMTALIGGALMTREGVNFARFARLTGLDFSDVRRTPFMAGWLDLLTRCGGEFIEDEQGFRMVPEVIHKAYITHLAYMTSTA